MSASKKNTKPETSRGRVPGASVTASRKAAPRKRAATIAPSAVVPKELHLAALRRLRARYDAAVVTDNNRRHWANADALSADAAASAGVRRKLRNHARYEVKNNSWAMGIGLSIVNDTIGTGPRLQMLTDSESLNRVVEREFIIWAEAVSLAERLRTMRFARYQDGEVFAVLIDNPAIDHQVKLDLQLLEAEQVAGSLAAIRDANDIDGVILDTTGNVIKYNVMKHHPGGSLYSLAGFGESFSIPADSMIHLFRPARPGQHRGIPDLTPSLPLFAMLRRYNLAVAEAAEVAANISGVVQTDNPVDEAAEVAADDFIEMERGMFTTMPHGWTIKQIKAEQPTTAHEAFVDKIITEIARCLCVPKNIALGDSGGYNYASGRLDDQIYRRAIRVDQHAIGIRVLDKMFAAWLREYAMVAGNVGLLKARHIPHQWFWDGTEHVDPAKEAIAQERRLKNHTTTLKEEYAKRGLDWEDQLDQRAKEIRKMTALGLTVEQAQPVQVEDETDAETDAEEESEKK